MNAPGQEVRYSCSSHSNDSGMTDLIFVAGAHRSGTSAFTRCLQIAGATLHSNLLPANEYNPSGYWESTKCVELNDKILRTLGATWSSPGPLPENWIADEALESLKGDACEILEALNGTELAVIKDPRVSRLLPFWLSVAEEAGFKNHVAICMRNPMEVADSLSKRDQFATEKSLMLWLRHTAEAIVHAKDVPRALVHFEDIVKRPRFAVESSFDQLGLKPNTEWAQFSEAVGAFLTPESVRSRPNPDYSSHLASQCERLWHSSHDGTDDLQSTAFAVENEMTSADRLLGSLVNSLDGDLTNQLREAKRLTHQSDFLRKSNVQLIRKDEDTRATLDEMRQSRNEFRQGVTNLESLLMEQEGRLSGMASTLEQLASTARVQTASLASLNTQITEEASARQAAESQVHKLQKHILELQESENDLVTRLRHSDNQLHRLRGSVSWKLTAPLRILARPLSRGPSEPLTIEQEAQLIRDHPLFDGQWYSNQYEIALSSPPECHFCERGWKKGWDPGPNFSTSGYLDANPDVAGAGINPLLHFICSGRKEGRSIRPSARRGGGEGH